MCQNVCKICTLDNICLLVTSREELTDGNDGDDDGDDYVDCKQSKKNMSAWVAVKGQDISSFQLSLFNSTWNKQDAINLDRKGLLLTVWWSVVTD